MKWKLVGAAGGITALVAVMFWLAVTRGPFAPVVVDTAPARQADITVRVFGIGTVEARRAYAVGPTQVGRVLRVHVDHGDAVKAGELLAEIDPVDLRQRLSSTTALLERARHAVQMAEAQLREAESRAAVAAANEQRYRDLVQRNFVSREALEIRESEASMARASSEAARSALLAARADVERASRDREALASQLDNLRLTSPVDGIVIAREAEPGTTVVAGQAVLRLIDPRSLWVRARIDQSRSGGIVPGLAADIVLRSRQADAVAGKVARVEIESDAVTEERVVAVEFAGAPPVVTVGELAEVTVTLASRPRALVVPSAAVKRVEQRTGVWEVVGGAAHFRPIRPGAQTLDGMTEVLDGLEPGHRVIVYSGAQLREGVKVRVGKVS